MQKHINIENLTIALGSLATALIILLSPTIVKGAFEWKEQTVDLLVTILAICSAILAAKRPERIRLSISEILGGGLLTGFILISCLSHPDSSSKLNMNWLALTVTCYIWFRIFFSIGKDRLFIWIAVPILGCMVCQICLFLLQKAGLVAFGQYGPSADPAGTFTNTGLLGGFLAMGISGLISFFIIRRKSIPCSTVSFVIITLLLIIAISSTKSRASLVGLAAGFTVGLIRHRQYFLTALTVTVGLVLSIYLYGIKKDSADARLYMDKVAVEIMLKKKGYGVGAGHFPSVYAEHQYNMFSSGDFTETARQKANIPTSCCNEFLEMGLEYGALCMLVLISLSVIVLVHSYRCGTMWLYPLIVWAVLALFSYPSVSFTLRILGVMALAGAITDGYGTETSRAAGTLCSIISLILVVVISFQYPWVNEHVKATRVYGIGQLWYREGNYRTIARNWDRISDKMDHNADFLFKYGYSLYQIGDHQRGDSVMRKFNTVSAEPVGYISMGDAALERKEYEIAESYYNRAFLTVPNRILPLARLAILFGEKHDTAGFNLMRDSVLHFCPRIENSTTSSIRYTIESTDISMFN